MGIRLREIVFDIGGGVPEGRTFKAVQTGGPSGGVIPESLLDLPIDFEALTEAGAMMGSGGMIVMDDRTCIVDVARYFMNFLREESCGKCTPCREGIKNMLRILTQICEGKGTAEDITRLETPGRGRQGGLSVRPGDDGAQSGPQHAEALPRRVPRPRGGQALPGRGVHGADPPGHRRGQVQGLRAVPEGLPDRRDPRRRQEGRRAASNRTSASAAGRASRPARSRRSRSPREQPHGMTDETFQLAIDGQTVEARPGETVLAVCRRAGKDIPTLCHHEALEPYAACRVCLVEVDWRRARAAWCRPASTRPSTGLVVQTDSPAVRQARRLVLELLLARCPASDVVRDLAARYGVTETPYPTDDPEREVHRLRPVRAGLRGGPRIAAIGFASRGRGPHGRLAVRRAVGGVHRLRGLRGRLPHRARPQHRRRAAAADEHVEDRSGPACGARPAGGGSPRCGNWSTSAPCCRSTCPWRRCARPAGGRRRWRGSRRPRPWPRP